MTDPFGTAQLRRRVLEAYAASPARLREDANAEEDLVLGGYRDRVVVELAQNAADSAVRAGVPGRLLLSLEDDRLVAANAGAPLDAAGVEALSTLRASSKRSADSAGRFGVGFAAVLAVSDSPAIGSRPTGGVGWSREAAVAALTGLASGLDGSQLRGELDRRGSAVPVLRLPEPRAVEVPEGYDTAVVLPLRAGARELVARLLDEVGPVLLLSLPALREVVVRRDGAERRVVSESALGGVLLSDGDASVRWRVVRRSTGAPADALATRPLEERTRSELTVTWAVPDGSGVALPGVVLAPTPTDEPLGLPAVLVATLPLEPTRRRAVPGPLLSAVARLAGEAYVELLEQLAAEDPARALAALPGPLAAGEVDALVRATIAELLPRAAVVPGADGGLVAPERAVLVDGASPSLAALLADELDGVAAPVAARSAGLLERLGARRLALADAVDSLAGRSREPAQWQALYAALADAPLDALGALPVPLADGRVVRGARGTVLVRSGNPVDPRAFEVLGVRVVDPAAAHPLLERLGAVPATPAALLEGPEVRGALDASESMDDDEALEVSRAVLALVEADPSAARSADLSGLLLPDDEGELAPAHELLLPGGALAAVADPDAFGVVDADLVERWGADVLRAVGVADGFAVVTLTEVALDPDELDALEIDGLGDWVMDVAPPHGGLPWFVPELEVVRDLDAVADDRWPDALALLGQPPARAAVVEQVRVVSPSGDASLVPSYAAWWLRRRARVSGWRLTEFALGSDSLLLRLFSPLPVPLDPELATAMGVRSSLDAVLSDADGVASLLDRLAADECTIDRRELTQVYSALARSAVETSGGLPDAVRVPDGATGTRLVDADDAVVLDAPDLLPLLERYAVVPLARDLAVPLAELLRLPLASEIVDVGAPGGGVLRTVPELVGLVLPTAPRDWVEHDEISVGAAELSWRVVDGEVHASTLDGLAKGLAWAAGRWELRGLVGRLLADPSPAAVEALLAEHDLDG